MLQTSANMSWLAEAQQKHGSAMQAVTEEFPRVDGDLLAQALELRTVLHIQDCKTLSLDLA